MKGSDEREALDRLERRLGLTVGGAALLTVAVVFAIFVAFSNQMRDRERLLLEQITASVTEEAVNAVGATGRYRLRLTLDRISKANPEVLHLAVANRDGRFIAHSDSAREGEPMADAQIPYLTEALSEHGRVTVDAGGGVREIYMPYYEGYGQQLTGVVVLGLDLSGLDEDEAGALHALGALIVLIVGLTLTGLYLFSVRVGSPVKRLARQWQGLLEHAPLLLTVQDRDNRLMGASRRFRETFRLPPGGGLGQPLTALLDDVATPFLVDSHEGSEQDGPVVTDIPLVVDGEERSFQVSRFLIARDTRERPWLFCNIGVDITERRRAEQALNEIRADLERRVARRTAALRGTNELLESEVEQRHQVERLLRRQRDFAEALIETAPVIILVLDNDGRVVRFNPYFQQLAGIDEEHAKGQDWFEAFVPADVREAFRDHFRSLLESDRPGGYVLPVVGVGGGQRMIEWYDKPLGGIEGQTSGVMFVGLDITERRRAEEEEKKLVRELKDAHTKLLQSEKLAAIGQLAAGVAHEINNPVGYVRSNLSTLEGYAADVERLLTLYEEAEAALGNEPALLERINDLKAEIDLAFIREDLKALLRESEEGIQRVRQIVADLKDFSRVDERAKPQWADIHHGLDSTLNIVYNELKYKAKVVKEYGDLPEIKCVPSQLNQVFMNLLVNAGQAIDEHGTITIRTGHEADWVWVEVEDTGRGIPKASLERIFEPFYTTKPVGRGTGLGLSLSYGIVTNHKGRIEVDSVEGEGSRFRVWLPVDMDAAG